MPRKSIKQSDDEGAVRFEEIETEVERAGGVDKSTGANGSVNHDGDSEPTISNDKLTTGDVFATEEALPDGESVPHISSTEAVMPLEEVPVAETSTTAAVSAEEESDIVQGAAEADAQISAGVFPLEIEHELEVTPEEAMATGWPGVALPEEDQPGASAFPIEIANGHSAASGETIALGWTSESSGEIIGAIELAPQDIAPPSTQEPEEGGDSSTDLASHGSVPIEQRAEEVIGAVELAPRGETSNEQSSAEIIGPIELAQFFAETSTDPAGIVRQTPVVAVETATPTQATERRHLVKSAALVSVGNLGSSLMGMARQIVVAGLGPGIAGPFNAALTPANNFFQLLINGSVSGALVPTFNDYAAPEKRQEMRRVVFTLVNLILLLALVASIGYALIAPWFINLLVQGYSQQSDKLLTLQYSQIIFFSLVALGPFAVLLSALFALKEFGWPAFATAAYHVGIILGAIGLSYFGSFYWGKLALPAGVLLGAVGEIALLFPGIRRQRFYYMFVLDLKHPALRRIIKLYFPILVSYAFTTALVFLDVNLWTRAGGNGTANTVAQATATALLQFPVGLVAMALGFAVLPTLTEHAREGNDERFKGTLLLGFRVGLLLMIPAMVGMWVLRLPIVYLLFAHHNNNLANAGLSALALQNYVYQLPFVAVDQLLIAAFYARKNTLTPVVVGIVCIGFYLLVALPFFQTIGIAALAFANTVQNSMHAIILLILLRRAIGSLHVRQTIPAVLKICVAAAAMGVVAWGAMTLLSHVSLFSLNHLIGQLLTVIVAGGLATVVYVGGVLLFKVEEINLVKRAVLAKLGKK